MSEIRYALITGASRGIGKAIALKLASGGYHILLNYQSNDSAADETIALIESAGGAGTKLKFDVSDEKSMEAVMQNWMNQTGVSYIEVLVNNAGIKKDNLMMWMTNEEWKSVVNTSLDGFFYITRFLLKPMLTKRYGRIVNIVSLSGVKGMSGQTNYSSAKAAVIGATKSLAQEVAKRKITVNAVAPGFIKTDMTSDIDPEMYKKMIPMERFGEVEEVASLVHFLVSKEASYITGEVIHVNGGLYT